MVDRSIRVILRAEAAQYRSEMNAAAKATSEVGAASQATTRQVQASADQIDRASKRVSEARRQELDATARLNTAEKKLDEVKRNNKATAAQVAQAEERAITSRNRLEKATENLSDAEKSHAQAMQVATKQANSSQGALSKLARQAEANREAWTTAGTALSIFGGAIVGVGVAAAKTGGEYNTLQQTSRAAMKTLLGGAKEANAQMDKLDAFAKNSPFAKQVFIQAQQQMIGFGIEAKKVIPYLDAVQNAVAATGGSNQQLTDLVQIMAKVHATGKLTAQDLMEFGNRGVDAASLIGAAMNKTGAEIREDITNGALGADQALDALTKGMDQKFAGAAAGIKEQMTGATDRVKSAWRDLSAAIVEPFVSKNGGGLAVDWLNTLADKMRDFEGLDAPLRNTALALGGIVGVASLAAGGFLVLAPRILETQKAFQTLSGQSGIIGATTRGMGKVGKAAGILAGGFIAAQLAGAAFTAMLDTGSRSSEEMKNRLVQLNEATQTNVKNTLLDPAIWEEANGFWTKGIGAKDIETWGDAFDRSSDKASKWIDSILNTRSDATILQETIDQTDVALTDMANNGAYDQVAKGFQAIAAQSPDMLPEDVLERFPALRDHLSGVATEMGLAADGATLVKLANGEIKPATDDAAEGFTGLSAAAQAAQEHLEEVRSGLLDGANGFLDFTSKAKESKTTLQEWISDMEKQVKAQAEWMDNLAKLAERGAPQELLDQLLSMGPEGARMVKELADGSDADMQRVIDVFADSKRNVNEFAESITGLPPIDIDADSSKLKEQIGDAKDRLKELEKLPTSPTVDAQITLLKEKIKEGEAKLNELDKKKANPKISADSAEAKKQIRESVRALENADGKEANLFVKIWRTLVGDNDSGAAKKSGGGRKGVEKRAKMLKDPFAYATGGEVSGPGTGTSDSIPTMLSNGEHVWTAYEVQRAGGHGAIEAMRRAVVSGQRLAKGGAVGTAEKRVDSATTELRRARRAKSDAKTKASKAAAENRVRAAEDELETARKSLKSAKEKAKADEKSARIAAQQAKEAKRIAEQKAKEEKERRQRVGELQSDLRVDVRRGNIRDQVTSGLSGGYSAVDRLFDLGSNQDLSRGSRSRANSSARKFEANLKALYSQAEKIDAKLKKAQDKATELKGIKDSVVSSLLGGRDLDVGTFQTRDASGAWSSQSNLGQAAKSMKMDVGAMKAFAGKLKKLTELGIPGAIIQQIAQAGPEEGSNMADSFIGATAAERKSYLGAWSDYEKYANQAGQYVTEGFYKGGSAAADGVVKGLEGKQKNVEAAIANLAKVMESTFKSVLGIHSPSRVMSELGGFTAEGLVQGMLGGVTDVQSAAAALGAASVPNMMAFQPDMSMDVGVNPVVADDEGMAGLAMQDMSDTTLEAMGQMNLSVSEGFAGMLANIQAAQAGMLLSTQETQLGMLTSTQTQNAAMLLNTQTQQAAMLTNTQTQYEAMRAVTSEKQNAQRTVMTEQQELMRLMLADKQSQMKSKSAEDFESLKNTTGSKFSAMRTATDTTMVGMHGDYSSRLGDLKSLNKSGFESLLDTSNKNMRGVRDGIDGQMAAAKPELGGRMNALIGVLASFTASVNKAFKDVGVDLKAPKALKFESGGVMPGYSPGRDIHHFQSPSAGDLYLSGGEAIMRPEFTRAVGGEQGVEALNKAARSGSDLNTLLGQFATGGVVPRIPGVNAFADSGVWRNLWAITKEKFPNARLTSAYRPNSRTASGNTSHHSRGNAIDVSPSMDIFNFWRNTYGSNLAELIYSPAGGKQVKNGKNYTYTGAVKAMHYNHVHIAAIRALSDAMAGGLPGAGGEMSHPFLDRAGVSAGGDLTKAYQKAAEKLTADIYAKHAKQLPDGIAGQLGKGIMSMASEGLVDKAKDYGKKSGMDFSGVANGPVKNMAKQMLEAMGWGDQFGDLDWLLTRESGWNPNAQNPTSTAYGLFQFLNGTWGSVGAKKTSDPRAQLEAGLKYIKQRYGDVKGARSFWERNHWYEGGTTNAKRGLAVVGEQGPELVNFRGGEQVMSTTDSMKFMAANRTYIPAQSGPSFDASAFTDAVSRAVQVNGVTPEAIATAMNNVRMTFVADTGEFSGVVTAVVGSGYDQSRSRLSKSSQKIGAR